MPAEGMVHALEICWELLAPDGYLVDIHPIGEPPPIEAHSKGQIHTLGFIQETDDFIEYKQATTALAKCVERGLYILESRDEFVFITRADSLDELREYLAATWSDAIIPEQVDSQAALLGFMQADGRPDDFEISFNERASISRLKKTALS